MAFLRTLGADDGLSEGAEYDPRNLSSPQVFLLSMLIFLAIVGFVAAILYRQISTAFQTNPGLNGLTSAYWSSASCLSSGRCFGLCARFAGSTPSEPAPRRAILFCWRR